MIYTNYTTKRNFFQFNSFWKYTQTLKYNYIFCSWQFKKRYALFLLFLSITKYNISHFSFKNMNYCLPKKFHSGNTMYSHYMNNLYGDASNSPFQLSSFKLLLKELENNHIFYMSEIYCILEKLDKTLLCWSSTNAEVFQVLKDFYLAVGQVEKNESELQEDQNELEVIVEKIRFYKDFMLDYSVKIFRRFLESPSLLPFEAAHKLCREKNMRLYEVVLGIMLKLFNQYECIAEKYTEDQGLINCLLIYMQFKETWYQAYKLLQYLICIRKNVLDLSAVENLPEIVMRLNDVQFGAFCKILAISLSELDMYENKTCIHVQTQEKKNQNFIARNVNHDVILKIPKILSRLIDIACACVPLYRCAHPNEHRLWFQWINNQLNVELQKDSSSFDDYSELTMFDSFRPLMAFQISLNLTFRADALCALSLLLVGRYRKEVQKKLVELQLIPRFSILFDQFIWRINQNEYGRVLGHRAFCGHSSPQNELKIQMLRLIHDFCDLSDYRYVMLSWKEYSELQSLRSTLNLTTNSPWVTSDIMCDGNVGLLSKLVSVIKIETWTSTYRFWLARAIESFLRGSSVADQLFLLRRNLLQNVVQNLVLSNGNDKKHLQSSFDLIGELVRFNLIALKELHSPIFDDSRVLTKFRNLMDSNIVDSNMCIRSFILSYVFYVI